ncbi:MAG: hypothetical protein BWZ01_02548 [Deltaproteobacteria bacterium ADurb.BinA179]|nr:MAG: hypothetical protein BWZ01_02548 [Deltaproteobacteria bacterium ADurb.BinA179]
MNCGSSSILSFRMTRPTRVTRGSFCDAHWGPFFSASCLMDLNLIRLKSLPSFPTRC